MKACAGSWLICSVCIERTMQMSSAIAGDVRERSEISWPESPCLWNSTNGPRALSTEPCNCASCCPFVNDSGNGWPSSRFSSGFQSKRLELRRPARHAEVDDPLRLDREVWRLDDARPVRLRGRRGRRALAGRADRPAQAPEAVGRAAEERPAVDARWNAA